MLRLVAYAPNGVERFAVDRDLIVIGSSEDCDVRLCHPGVYAEHARLRTVGDSLVIEDLGTRKGILVNGKRTKEASLQVLDEIRLGTIALLLEDVLPSPSAEPGITPPSDAKPMLDAGGLLGHLAQVSQWVLSDSSTPVTLESLMLALLKDLGGGVLFLFQGERDERGIKFVVASDARWLGRGEELLEQVYKHLPKSEEPTARATAFNGRLLDSDAWIGWRLVSAVNRPYLMVVGLPGLHSDDLPEAAVMPSEEATLAALSTLTDQLILGLVHHVGQFEPIIFGLGEGADDLTLAPGLVAGESEVMQKVLEQLRAAIDPVSQVLLRGEAGVSKQLLAETLHLSGPFSDGPFVVASCRGTTPKQVEADLFGAEVQGKRGIVRREGKLEAADGGTLYLTDVEHLPLHLQDRLVRFLRSGEVEPVDSLSSRQAGLRLICSSAKPLAPLVSRDSFRIDLAYRLGQVTIDVPPLRERREDLPLLIQAAVNRCCHQMRKRVQGITVKALEALTAYNYPGNLPELENIVRHLVQNCPAGRPIQPQMLPEEVRLAKIPRERPAPDAELNLDKLVADCERAAILEALHRTGGNKSAAARALHLSRNGLALKMGRLGLD